MTGVERAEQAEPEPVYWFCNSCGDEVDGEFAECCDDGEIEPSCDEPNPPYDLPAGVNSWAEWMDR